MKKRKGPPRPVFDETPWARISTFDRFGPFAWHVQVGHGISKWGPDGGGWFAWTEAGARKKAARKLVAMQRWLDRQKTVRL